MKKPKIGLALGSGAIRGFAAIPVIQRLRKEGIDIEAVSGSSIGALIAAILALNGEVDSLWENHKSKKKKDYLRLIDANNPRKSLIKGKKLKEYLRQTLFGEKTFADTRIPLFISAVNFRTKQSVYFDRGLILDAVMASISMPGIFPPYEFGGGLYLDGGVLDPVPTAILRKQGIPKIVGVNFMGFKVEKQPEKTSMLSMLLTAFYMMMEQMTAKETSEQLFMLHIDFKPDPANMLSFWKSREYYNAGVESINKKIDALKQWLSDPQ